MKPEISKSDHVDVGHVEDGSMKDDPKMTLTDAQIATEEERNMSLLQGIKTYPKAIAWSVFISTCCIMDGYDLALMGAFYAFPAFRAKYGVLRNGSYEIPAQWQAGLNNAVTCGQIIGLFIAGIAADRFGYRKTMISFMGVVSCFIFILFFAPNLSILLVGQIFMGLPLGAFQTLSVSYASEVCPVVLRAYLTTYVNLCHVMGQLLASGVLKSLSERGDEWAYRIPFAVQWAWPLPMAIGIYLAPESPWWLVRHDRKEEAVAVLKRLAVAKDGSAEKTVAMMIHTNELEMAAEAGTSYLDCFKGVNRRRTEITCFTWATGQFNGSGLMAYATYFFLQAGLSSSHSFTMTIGQYAIGFFGTLLSWVLMTCFQRRTVFISGLVALVATLMTIGCLSFSNSTGASWASGVMMLFIALFHNSSTGPGCYTLVSELSSTRLRTKTTIVARNVYNICTIINNILTPYMLNPTAWNWRGKAGFFWGGVCLACTVWCYFRLPEPKGRTYAELEVLFERGISARKFSKTKVDLFDHESASNCGEEEKDRR